jgi:hypothetical protein
MIDEFAKRKPNFDERNAAPVVLADGQKWHIPKPWLEVRPVFRNGRADHVYHVLTCGRELDELIEAMMHVEEQDQEICAVASLAAYLLRYHYDLGDDELDQLLAFRVADPASLEWVTQVFAIATGRSGPKRGRAGDD